MAYFSNSTKAVKKKVFVSYDHSEDLKYKNLLKAWDAHPNFEFEFDQRSPDVAINSTDAAAVKTALTKKIKEADYLLVIVGAKSDKSKWMNWEGERATASDTKLKLAAVKISNSYSMPDSLLGKGCSIASAFEQAKVVQALNAATNTYTSSDK